jgi:hypothetical protein
MIGMASGGMLVTSSTDLFQAGFFLAHLGADIRFRPVSGDRAPILAVPTVATGCGPKTHMS